MIWRRELKKQLPGQKKICKKIGEYKIMNKIIVANWKMQIGPEQGLVLAKEYKRVLKNVKNEVVACPDFLALSSVAKIFPKTKISLGAQDCAPASRGALTGEVSAADLIGLGARYIILGHSERRLVMAESNDLIRLKIEAALKERLIPIICVGESLPDKEAGKAKEVLSAQLKSAIKGLKLKKASDIIIAYEPIWAIGTGEPIIPVEAESIHRFLKAQAAKIIGQIPRVIYGGSVNAENASAFLKQENVDGLLVGGASLDANKFVKICS